MTVHLSPHKVRKIIRDYFNGIPQMKIAGSARVDQSSVSHYATRFKMLADHHGLSVAGEEFDVKSEVDSLRSLSVELYQSKLTVEDARKGYGIIKAFTKLGISPEKHLDLVQLCKKIDDPNFPQAALKLSQIEIQANKDYHQIMSALGATTTQLQQLDKNVLDRQTELTTINNTISQKKNELTMYSKQLQESKIKYGSQEAALENKLSMKMQQMHVTMKEVEDAAALKIQLSNKGLNLETVLKLVKEFKYGK